jgi:hypothetical protein
METTTRTPITGKEGAEIDLLLAAEWTKNHRERNPHALLSQFFGIEILQRLLQQPGCLGIRIYYSNSQRLNGWQRFIFSIANFLKRAVAGAPVKDHFILVGVNSGGLDLLPSKDHVDVTVDSAQPQTFAARANAAAASAGKGVVVEQAHPCPGSANCPQNVLTGSGS